MKQEGNWKNQQQLLTDSIHPGFNEKNVKKIKEETMLMHIVTDHLWLRNYLVINLTHKNFTRHTFQQTTFQNKDNGVQLIQNITFTYCENHATFF